MTSDTQSLTDTAPAKVNLTLRVLGRRPDGYHELDSVVAFAAGGDGLSLAPGGELSLSVSGPTATAAGPDGDNLVLKAAHALAQRIPGLRLGRFTLDKRLPVAAGLGGGSSDAAAALRLLARLNGLAPADPRLHAATVATGADVPVCLEPCARVMRGVGDRLSPPLVLPPLPAVLANPGVAVPTRDVFVALNAGPMESTERPQAERMDRGALERFIAQEPNDLEPPAIGLQPVIATVLADLRAQAGCRLARMSGSGATCFGLFATEAAAAAAAAALQAAHPPWWVSATTLS